MAGIVYNVFGERIDESFDGEAWLRAEIAAKERLIAQTQRELSDSLQQREQAIHNRRILLINDAVREQQRAERAEEEAEETRLEAMIDQSERFMLARTKYFALCVCTADAQASP